MKLSEQVCTMEQAEQLKELGIRQDSYFSWCGDKTKRLMDDGVQGMHYGDWVFVNTTLPCNNQEEDHRDMVPSAKPFAAAFTVAELGVMLPETNGIMAFATHYNDHIGAWYCELRDLVKWEGEGIPPLAHEEEADTEAEARAAMLIHVLENKLATPEEINNRLNEQS